MNKLKDKLLESLEKLKIATTIKEEYEIVYTLEEAKMTFDARTVAFSNQKQRDAQLRLLMEESGMYEKLINVRTNSRIAYYEWTTFKSLVDS